MNATKIVKEGGRDHTEGVLSLQILKPGGLLLFRDYGLYDMTQVRFISKRDRKVGENYYQRADGTRTFFFSIGTRRMKNGDRDRREIAHSLCSLEFLASLTTKMGFETVSLHYDTRELRNRKRNISMYRVWLNGIFKKPGGVQTIQLHAVREARRTRGEQRRREEKRRTEEKEKREDKKTRREEKRTGEEKRREREHSPRPVSNSPSLSSSSQVETDEKDIDDDEEGEADVADRKEKRPEKEKEKEKATPAPAATAASNENAKKMRTDSVVTREDETE